MVGAGGAHRGFCLVRQLAQLIQILADLNRLLDRRSLLELFHNATDARHRAIQFLAQLDEQARHFFCLALSFACLCQWRARAERGERAERAGKKNMSLTSLDR